MQELFFVFIWLHFFQRMVWPFFNENLVIWTQTFWVHSSCPQMPGPYRMSFVNLYLLKSLHLIAIRLLYYVLHVLLPLFSLDSRTKSSRCFTSTSFVLFNILGYIIYFFHLWERSQPTLWKWVVLRLTTVWYVHLWSCLTQFWPKKILFPWNFL